jgi:hypothetical protein
MGALIGGLRIVKLEDYDLSSLQTRAWEKKLSAYMIFIRNGFKNKA